MPNKLHDDGLGQKGLSAAAYADRLHLPVSKITRYCRQGRIWGARKHPLTKKWWIYPPAKLLLET